jgi:uncharacterized OsmC-like protein
MSTSTVRQYRVHARSMDTFGRVLAGCRQHHFVVDGPVENGCPGEATTPAELFLAGVAACGVELLQVIARDRGERLDAVEAEIEGTIDRANPVRQDVTVFNSVRLSLALRGVNEDQARRLVEAFKAR